jgi:Fe-S-cluster-containing dehydrogenase component/CRP-like cAMP-binding protein
MIDQAKWWNPEMTDQDMEKILSLELFQNIDPEAFPTQRSLQNILYEHTRLVTYRKGDIIIRAGDYGNSAFLIAEGQAHLIIKSDLPEKILGRAPQQPTTWFKELAKLWKNPRYPEVRQYQSNLSGPLKTRNDIHTTQVFLQDVVSVINLYGHTTLTAGELFGEIAALGRTPRTATIIATSDSTLLEIRWQALQALRKYNNEFHLALDKLYRKNSLRTHLRALPIFSHLSKSELQRVIDHTLFESYGEFEWQNDYKKDVAQGQSSLLKNEPLIVAEGDYADGLLLIRSNFARVSHKYNHGHHVLKYLGRGDEFGLSMMLHNWQNDDKLPLPASLHAVGYTDILRVPSHIVEELIFPHMPDKEIQRLTAELESLYSKKDHYAKDLRKADGMLDFMSDYRFINGSASMLIDMDRCIRCDDCVTACAAGHNNNPRFNRHGRRHDHFMVANACMHCIDPVCMIGCPTGAIHRRPDGQIAINDNTCIGCSSCADSCPYDNIRMVQARDNKGDFMHDENTQKPIFKASKCDLCVDQLGGPACERACPHDALKRFNIQDLSTLVDWMER